MRKVRQEHVTILPWVNDSSTYTLKVVVVIEKSKNSRAFKNIDFYPYIITNTKAGRYLKIFLKVV